MGEGCLGEASISLGVSETRSLESRSVSDAKLHHFVPQFYLRHFADEDDRVAVRHRTRGTRVSSVEKVAAENGLYKVPNRPLTAEYTLGDVETLTAAAFNEVCRGRLPPRGSDARQVLSLFMALQLNRSPTSFSIIRFYDAVKRALGPSPVNESDMRDFLADLYGFEPKEPEVGAACDLINGAPAEHRTKDEIKEDELKLMFDKGLQVAPLLYERVWSLESLKVPRLVTSDRPVVLWNPPRPEDDYRGVGLLNAEEIWLLVDRERMVVLRRAGPERVRRIGPERVDLVNTHIARHCTAEVFAHPDAASELELDALPLASRRPMVRFWRGPLIGAAEEHEILHTWHPIRDVPDRDSSPY
jgi:Protein of unknown function (DUF4238)